MVKKRNKQRKAKYQYEFIDDIFILGKHIDAVKDNFKTNLSQNDSVRIGNIELYFLENKVDSLYYFPKQNIGNNHLNS